MAIKIVVDSASDITKAEAQKIGITMIPMIISFGGEDFFDGEDITQKEFYEKLMESKEFPKTTQITPYRFEEVFQDLTAHGDQVIAITISSKLSGTYESAVAAAQKFGGNVLVVDSYTAAAGERLLVLYAQRLIKEGLAAQEVVQKLDQEKHKICIMAMVNTLEYLKKGGRISGAAAMLGTALALKPTVAIVDGEVKNIGKSIGVKRAQAFMLDAIKSKGGIRFDMPHCAIWSGTDDAEISQFVKKTPMLCQNGAMPIHILGSTIGTHVGPGAMGLAFFRN